MRASKSAARGLAGRKERLGSNCLPSSVMAIWDSATRIRASDSSFSEYLKSRKIKKVREQYPDFDKIIVKKIRDGEIGRAVDVRDSLPEICVGPVKNLKRFVEGKIDFDDAHHNAMDAGGGNADYKRLHNFRQWLAKTDTEKDLVEVKEKNICDKIEFELDKIEKRSKQLKTAMTKKATRAKQH